MSNDYSHPAVIYLFILLLYVCLFISFMLCHLLYSFPPPPPHPATQPATKEKSDSLVNPHPSDDGSSCGILKPFSTCLHLDCVLTRRWQTRDVGRGGKTKSKGKKKVEKRTEKKRVKQYPRKNIPGIAKEKLKVKSDRKKKFREWCRQ